MWSVIAAVIEPFLLIAFGYALRRTKRFGDKALWDGIEKLVYFVLFPPLLFNSVASAQLNGFDTVRFLVFGTLAMTGGVFMAQIVSKMAPADRMTDASVRQTGYRFNSYICFALALHVFGSDALALVALLTGIWVPISNAVAVADLASAGAEKSGKSTSAASIAKSIFTNPLIVATLAGLFTNIFCYYTGLKVPSIVTSMFKSLGSASVATALLAIGAGLAVEDFRKYKRLITLSTVQRLAFLPAFAWVVAYIAGLEGLETAALMCYAVVPTANSCYILATRMGGNGAVVSDLTSVEVLVALVSIPLWVIFLQRMLAL